LYSVIGSSFVKNESGNMIKTRVKSMERYGNLKLQKLGFSYCGHWYYGIYTKE